MQKILVVDDEKEILAIFTLVLESLGYSIITAGTAKEGLEMSRSFHPDLALLDIRLPDMEGTALLENLRATDPHMILLVMSGDPHEEARKIADGFMLKPFGTDYLVSVIRKNLGEQDALARPGMPDLNRKPALIA